MFNLKNLVWAIVLLALVATVPILLLSRGNGSTVFAQQNQNESEEPIADYASSQSSNEKRQDKGKRYNKRGGVVTELPDDVDELPINVHWWQGLPPLPVAQSDAVVLGAVTDRQTYLSSDKTGVYSEFEIRIEQVLKTSNQAPLAPGSTIIAERPGGVVRFSSGKIQHYRISGQEFPKKNKRYVFFLQRVGQEQDFSIVTGYELQAGHIFPLDGRGEANANGKLPFARYEGVDESAFLNAVQQEVVRCAQSVSNAGGQPQ